MSNPKSITVPNTLILVFGVAVFAWILSSFIPVGSFELNTISYQQGEKIAEKEVLKPGSFEYRRDAEGQPVTQGAQLFDSADGEGFLNFAFNGLTVGDRTSGAVAIVAFLLIIGGAFGMIMAPTTINRALLKLLSNNQQKALLVIPLLCFIFSLGGAVFGMGEEAIAFAMILTPVMRSQGYNGVVVVLCTYVATQVGFATSWMNPFNIGIAQGLAEVPILSGAGFRFVMWAAFTLVLMIFVTNYSKSIRKPVNDFEAIEVKRQRLGLGDWLVLINLLAGLLWVIWGVSVHGYYIAEIATQFFAIGLSSAVITLLFKLDGLTANDLADKFTQGAKDLLPAALIVGFAQGILLILGGANPATDSTLNTILNSAATSMAGLSSYSSGILMYWFQSIFNVFVTSGSGQAALTIPLMAPISDLVGVSRQTAVLTFQLGDGLTNIIVPTSASLMGTLGVAKVDWLEWAKVIWKFLLMMMLIAMTFIVIAIAIGF